MGIQVVFVFCGVIIFILSSIFAGVFSYKYDVDIYVSFAFLAGESVAIFVTTYVFLRAYYTYTLKAVRKAIKRVFDYDSELEKDSSAMAVINDIKAMQEELKKTLIVKPEEIDRVKNEIEGLKEIVDKKRENVESLRSEAKNMRQYIDSNVKIFEKIKAIGFEIKNTSKSIDRETQEVLADAKKQSVRASNGVKAIGHEIQSITELKQSIISSTKVIQELMDMSKRIKSFVSKIADMAKKTNLLALNAGIEAARAGEAGKSFSVVANEIKELSTNSNQSAEDITAILTNINERTTEVIEMIRMTEKIEDNIQTFFSTGDIFIAIVKDVKHIEKVIKGITAYTEEHFTDSELLFQIISDINKRAADYVRAVERIEAEVDESIKKNISLNAEIDRVINETGKIGSNPYYPEAGGGGK